MMKLAINDKEYKVIFTFNSFCDTDLMERIQTASELFADEDSTGMSQIKEMFGVIRDLLYVGFKRYNPVDDIHEVGDLIDDYMNEDGNSLLTLFGDLMNELTEEGFLAELMTPVEETK